MENTHIQTSAREWNLEFGNLCIGGIVSVTADGSPYVDFLGNTLGPVRARTLITVDSCGNDGIAARPVLLGFEHGNIGCPVILGMVHERMYHVVPKEGLTAIGEQRSTEAMVDRKRVEINASDEVLLRCGKSSILLKRDGKIIIKGAEIVSRSSGTNKIKGASVAIN